jgi:hypothetical protein
MKWNEVPGQTEDHPSEQFRLSAHWNVERQSPHSLWSRHSEHVGLSFAQSSIESAHTSPKNEIR